jgi:hypothetical protein
LLNIAHQPIHLLLEPAEPGLQIARRPGRDAFLVVGLPTAAAIAGHIAPIPDEIACPADHIADCSFSVSQPIAQCFEPATEILGVPAAINRQLDLVAGVHATNRGNELVNGSHGLAI